MIKQLLTFGLLLSVFGALSAQQQQLHPCGTHEGRDDWYEHYLAHPETHDSYRGGISTIYIPLKLHLVGTNAGTGYYDLDNALADFCRLNNDFLPAGIQFFLFEDIAYIPNSAFYSHADITEGAAFMLQYNTPNVLNCYIVADPAGNCGYNMKYAGNMMAKSCMSGHTWAHEIGHYFNAQHPFLGWEGKTYNYAVPTPDTVTADYTNFHDTLWGPDTTILDTLLVEYLDRSINCNIAADGLCDTYSDYLSYRFACNATTQISNAQQKDPTGADFHSDASLIMSYALDECQSRFSPDQIDVMRNYIFDRRQNHLFNQNPNTTAISGITSPVSPVNGSTDNPLGPTTFTWRAVPGATHYVWQMSVQTNFGSIQDQFVTTDTFYTSSYSYNQLPSNRMFQWRVQAFNEGYFCTQMSPQFTFNCNAALGTQSLATLNVMTLYPQPLERGSNLQLELSAATAQTVEVEVLSVSGQVLETMNLNLHTGTNTPSLNTLNLSAGLYLLRVRNEQGQQVVKFVVY